MVCPSPQRRGLSLFEVVIATVILAGSLAILGQLIDRARSAASRTANELHCLSRCESIMSATCLELSTGVTVPDVLLEEDSFLSTVDIEPTDSETLVRVTVHTKHFNSQSTLTADVKLVRLVLPLPEEEG